MAVYAVSDIHGMYELWEQIKNFLTPNDTLYVLGDCADRGSNGWKIIEEVCASKQMIYIKGNHENMLMNAMKDYFRFKDNDEVNAFWTYSQEYKMCDYNGGAPTFKSWHRKTKDNPRWIHVLDNLPLKEIYYGKMGKVILSHAGFTPYDDGPYDYLWDRTHFYEEWPENEENTYIVHGHTPTPYLLYYLNDKSECQPGAYFYCEGHKIDIDCGSFFTGCTTLLDLDTFEQHIFMTKDCIYKEDSNE